MFLAIILLFAGAVNGDAAQQAKPKTTGTPAPIQQPAKPISTAPNQSETTPTEQVKTATPGAKQVLSQKGRTWQIKIKDSFGVPFISLQAKKAPRSEISAELGRMLKIPVVLGASVKQQQITGDFEDQPLEAVVKLLAPRPFIDYIISGGGDTTHAARKRPIAVYLLGEDDKVPADSPWKTNKAAGQLIVGMVYATAEEEKEALEKKRSDLQVAYNEGLFTVRVYKQFLTDVLQEVADQARVPFAILTTNGAQKEIDQVVTWNMAGVNFEELTNTWFPNGVRLYWRTDLASDISTPLRLTIEDREEDAQAAQNVTP